MNNGFPMIMFIISLSLLMFLNIISDDKDINDKSRKEKEQYMNQHNCKKVDHYFSSTKGKMVVSLKCPNGKILII